MTAPSSPNFDARPAGQRVDMIVVHYTGMQDGAAALARLCDPAAKVSAHYLIDEDGSQHVLVPETQRAWHAGIASWQGATDINARSIGIELVNPGHEWGYRPFQAAQMTRLLALIQGVVARHHLPPDRILGHSDVAPLRKADPGELFDWSLLARHGLGLWPSPDFRPSEHAPVLDPGSTGPAVIDLQLGLHTIGYGVEGSGLYDAATEAVVRAFQRHFRPGLVDGIADAETGSVIHHLAQRR